jgi:hypothetical protein
VALPYLIALAASGIALVTLGPGNLLVVAILIAIGGLLALKPLVETSAAKVVAKATTKVAGGTGGGPTSGEAP